MFNLVEHSPKPSQTKSKWIVKIRIVKCITCFICFICNSLIKEKLNVRFPWPDGHPPRLSLLSSKLANLTKSNLTKSNLTKSNLTKSSLTKSNLTKSNLTKSNLTKSNLTKSNLTKSNLTKSNLTKSNLTQNYQVCLYYGFYCISINKCFENFPGVIQCYPSWPPPPPPCMYASMTQKLKKKLSNQLKSNILLASILVPIFKCLKSIYKKSFHWINGQDNIIKSY